MIVLNKAVSEIEFENSVKSFPVWKELSGQGHTSIDSSNSGNFDGIPGACPFGKTKTVLPQTQGELPEQGRQKVGKRRTIYIDLSKKMPQKRPRKKKITPKISIQGVFRTTQKPKPPKPSTLEPQTPNLATPKQKRKYTRKNPVKRSCSQALNFNNAGETTESGDVANTEAMVNSCCPEEKVAEKMLKKRHKKKKVTPKIAIEGILKATLKSQTPIPSTLRPQTPSPATPKQKMKYIRKVSKKRSFSQTLNFISAGETTGSSDVTNTEPFENSFCLEENGAKKIVHQYQRRSLGVYRKDFLANKCLWSSWKTGPNVSNKKRRIGRQKTTKWDTLNSALFYYLGVVSPTEEQIMAATKNPELFTCVLSLKPAAKSRKKRSEKRCKLSIKAGNTSLEEKGAKALHAEKLKEISNLMTNDAEVSAQILLGSSAKTKRKSGKPNTNDAEFSDQIMIRMPPKKKRGGPKTNAELPDQIPTSSPINPKSQTGLRKTSKLSHRIEDVRSQQIESDLHTKQREAFSDEFLELLWKLENLRIGDQWGQCGVVPCKTQNEFGQLVPKDQTANGAIVPYKSKKQKPRVKVNLDAETMRVWNLLMETDRSGVEVDKEKEKWWQEEREVFQGRIESFIARMHLIQGNRRFLPWRGSVLDSVIGVCLTQNVSDNLSSSAYLSLAARFPPKSTDCNNSTESSPSCSQAQAPSHSINLNEIECSTDANENIGGLAIEKITTTGSCESDNVPEKNSNSVDSEIVQPKSTPRKKNKVTKKQLEEVNWEELRNAHYKGKTRETNAMDSIDWEAVRCAKLEDIAEAIKGRGQHNQLADRIKRLLNRIVEDHGSLDLEWLRDVPPEKAKDFLLSMDGLGLKSVECVRLLTLHHVAFPVDVNVGRVAVRLGWVPLQPLPGELHIHLLDKFPELDKVQKYLWPRLCTLDQLTLYELHYQMITFGKVFCTMKSPNCNACPMRGDCRHFASALASTWTDDENAKEGGPDIVRISGCQPTLPGPQECSITSKAPLSDFHNLVMPFRSQTLAALQHSGSTSYRTTNSEPIIEEPESPEPHREAAELEDVEAVRDIEDCCDFVSEEEIPTIRLNSSRDEFRKNLLYFMINYNIICDSGTSDALVAINPENSSIPQRKIKEAYRLRTTHQVYVLPDEHPLLAGFEKRDKDDLFPYLLAIWTQEEDAKPTEEQINSREIEVYNGDVQQSYQTIPGTILIPCRTATRGQFPLNGTYFQINEVFADYESTECPIMVPTYLIWNLPVRSLYCGSSAMAIFRELSTREIQQCFWRGCICVRGFDRKTRTPRELPKKFHLKKHLTKEKGSLPSKN